MIIGAKINVQTTFALDWGLCSTAGVIENLSFDEDGNVGLIFARFGDDRVTLDLTHIL